MSNNMNVDPPSATKPVSKTKLKMKMNMNYGFQESPRELTVY